MIFYILVMGTQLNGKFVNKKRKFNSNIKYIVKIEGMEFFINF